MTNLNAVSLESYQQIQRRLRAAKKVADTMSFMYENDDFDFVTGRRIHNLTITWTEPGDHDE